MRAPIFWTCSSARLRLLLGGGRLRLGSLLAVAADHDHAEERADDGRAQQDEDDRDADGPHARREEVLERVVGVDKGLEERGAWVSKGDKSDSKWEQRTLTINRAQMV